MLLGLTYPSHQSLPTQQDSGLWSPSVCTRTPPPNLVLDPGKPIPALLSQGSCRKAEIQFVLEQSPILAPSLSWPHQDHMGWAGSLRAPSKVIRGVKNGCQVTTNPQPVPTQMNGRLDVELGGTQ